ncbi:zinc-finger homeodomain protein 4-like isoform X1 [Primulina tabacum]|uniref:zinc-finger homeodomain protein 4-like isoform X1 n=1 Tax=Primulina tabacum TaxID=48773 RepID=UPI003F59AA12
MEHPSEDEDVMPIPLSSTYGSHEHGQDHIIYHGMIPSPLCQIPTNAPFKKDIKYKECLKNHAASMGGNAIDGCGEFMPDGEEGTIEALTCSACSYHRNFHRKEIEGDPSFYDPGNCYHNVTNPSRIIGRKVFLRPHQMFMPGGNMESKDEGNDGRGGADGAVTVKNLPLSAKKRFRTKFTQEQKEKLFMFAEKVGWKMHKQEEDAVQEFCREIGVKRRVLKVWMHNNKNSLAKKYDPTSNS